MNAGIKAAKACTSAGWICRRHYELPSRLQKAENMKPNILICGLNQFDNTDLISCTTSVGTVPEEETDPIPSNQEESKAKPLALIRRVIETPIANFIEATEFLNDDSEEMFCEPMGTTRSELKRSSAHVLF